MTNSLPRTSQPRPPEETLQASRTPQAISSPSPSQTQLRSLRKPLPTQRRKRISDLSSPFPPRALKVRTRGTPPQDPPSPADTCEANTGSIYGDGFYKLLKTVDCLNKGVDERLKAARVTLGICEGLYEVGGKIGQGSYGVVFKGTRRSDKSEVAIKFEPRKCDRPQLRDEYRTYKLLSGCPGIPKFYYFGPSGLHNVLILQLLGPSLESKFEACGRRFPLKTVAMLAIQMLSTIRAVHEKNFVHRDIKPDNFVFGRSELDSSIYAVDFGMAKAYRDAEKKHITYRESRPLAGTARYMSINTHLGREQSRRDDLEAIGYVLLYFIHGRLPWQGIKAATDKETYEKIGRKKQETAVEGLCERFRELGTYLRCVRDLGFEDSPDYDSLQRLFSDALKGEGDTSVV